MTDEAKALVERLRQLANNTGKMTWVNDLPMPATAALHLSADLIETQAREIERLRRDKRTLLDFARAIKTWRQAASVCA